MRLARVRLCAGRLLSAIRCIAFAYVAVFASYNLVQAQRREPIVQDALIQDQAVLGLQPGVLAQEQNSKKQLLRQTRGLIQNELSIISDLCGLDQKQQQSLVDLAESEWRVKTNASIVKRMQEHVYGMIDLDSLAERIVRSWLEAVATADQLNQYDLELADRMMWRKKALVSKVLDTLEAKLNLSGVQMDQIEVILNEKWRDRWYRSLEATFDNTSMMPVPEIRPSWIAPILSDSQKAALVTRESQPKFGTAPSSNDSPSLEIDRRFRVGSTTSSNGIETDNTDSKGNKTKEGIAIIEGILKKAKEENEEGQVDGKKP